MRETYSMSDALDHARDFADFIVDSPTSYHAAAEVAERLIDAGYVDQSETDSWDASPGGHVVVRDGAVIAYRVPDQLTDEPSFRIVGAHTDSPGFKLKPNPDHVTEGWRQVGAEVYGGPLLNSWLDRDLGVAGRVLFTDGRTYLTSTRALLRIPQLAPHLDRSVNESLHLDRQRHMMPVLGLMSHSSGDVLSLLAAYLQKSSDDIDGHDLFLVPTEPPAVLGADGELFASWRLDNLSSVHAGLVALLQAEPADGCVEVLACFDHEEIGSASRSGAGGTFLSEVLRRTMRALGVDGDERHRMFARSWIVSADAGHSVHPNYPEYHDPDARPVAGDGPLLKINASQRYTTEGPGEHMWAEACRAADVPWQPFVSNNAVSCGSTIGPITATRLGIRSIDVGIPLLSMHSARELCAVDDLLWLAGALEAFFSNRIG